ncbi:phage tail protein [Marinomonas arenicola]|uniref:phage tail protein n=1 Tax=Marinomonas arenicola TaxID=569601 RepID=UPI00312020F8
MASVLMVLGEYKFQISSAAYSQLTKKWEWHWASQPLIGRTDALQCVGKASDTVSLTGQVAPSLLSVGTKQIQTLADMGNEMEPKLMVSGDGDVLGYWVIKSVQEVGTRFVKGGAPRMQTYQMELAFYGDSV